MRLLIKLLFLFFIPLPICGFNLASNSTPEIYLTSNEIGPLTAYQEDVELKVVVHSTTATRTFIDVFKCGPSQSDIQYSKTSAIRYLSNYKYNLTYILPLSDFLSNNGMYCEIRIENYNHTLVASFPFTLFPIVTNKTINAKDYIKKTFEVDNIKYRFMMSGLNKEKETISFPNYLSYLNIDQYYKLDLSSVYFSSNVKEITYTSALMSFYDFDNIFPYLAHFLNKVFIPLNIVKKDKYLTFEYKNEFYVNPKNCQMSLTPKDGFVLTKHFYLPVNEKNKMLDEKISIDISGFGVGKTNIKWSLEYLASYNLIGDCDTSQYCIVGEQV